MSADVSVAQGTAAGLPTPIKGTALEVRYDEKDQAKALGAMWDRELRVWYVPAGRNLRPFLRWLPAHVRVVDADTRGTSTTDADFTSNPPSIQLAAAAFVHLGQDAGAELDQQIGKATRSVSVVSPYLTPSLLDRLAALEARGVAVSLVTSAQGIVDRPDIARRLIRQQQHLDTSARDRRRRRIWASFWSALALVVIASVGAVVIHPLTLLLLLALPVPAIAFLCFFTTTISSYSYHPALSRVRIVASPFLHSKIYILDNEVAYVGSLNFTAAGLRSNFETSVRIDDPAAVSHLGTFVDRLFGEETWVELSPAMVATDLLRHGIWRAPSY